MSELLTGWHSPPSGMSDDALIPGEGPNANGSVAANSIDDDSAHYTHSVLREHLGLSTEAIDELSKQGVLG